MSQGRERPRPDGLPLTLVAPALDLGELILISGKDTKLIPFRYETNTKKQVNRSS